MFFFDFPAYEKNGFRWPQIRAGRIFFLLIQTLPTVWAERSLDFENCYVFDFVDPNFLDIQVPRSPDSQNFLDFLVPRFPDAAGAGAPRPGRNSQIPTLPLSQRTQGSNTLKGPLLRSSKEVANAKA